MGADGPGQEADPDDGRDRRDDCGDRPRPFAHLAARLQLEEDRPVGEEHRQRRQPAEQRVGVEQVEEGAGVLVLGVDRDAVDDVRPADSPEQRRQEAARDQRPLPAIAPAFGVAFAPELEADVADDQADQDQEEGQVEARKEGRVPLREGGEGGAAGDQQPDLVAVPDRPDRVQDRAPLLLVVADDADQHADPEVEPLEQEVAEPEDRDQDEPDDLEGGVCVHISRRGPAPGLARRLCPPRPGLF